MNDFEIRALGQADLPAVLEMAKGLAAHHGDAASLTLDALARDTLGDVPWVHVVVAKAPAGLVGYAALCPLVQLQFGVRGMDMHHLFVEKEARGRGVGRALIKASVKMARDLGCRYMTVGTAEGNTAAAQAYVSAGFEPLPPPGPRFRIKFDE